jgi:hypothetical protein
MICGQSILALSIRRGLCIIRYFHKIVYVVQESRKVEAPWYGTTGLLPDHRLGTGRGLSAILGNGGVLLGLPGLLLDSLVGGAHELDEHLLGEVELVGRRRAVLPGRCQVGAGDELGGVTVAVLLVAVVLLVLRAELVRSGEDRQHLGHELPGGQPELVGLEDEVDRLVDQGDPLEFAAGSLRAVVALRGRIGLVDGALLAVVGPLRPVGSRGSLRKGRGHRGLGHESLHSGNSLDLPERCYVQY